MSEQPAWRPATPADVPAIATLSNRLLAPYHEGEDVFADRLALSPEGCLVLADAHGLGGYVVSHPWLRAAPPKLGALLGHLPPDPDCWYLHDVAVDPRLRGGGQVADAVQRIAALSRDAGIDTLALVAVSGADGYWSRLGFRPAMTPALAAKLASYGADSVYMERAA